MIETTPSTQVGGGLKDIVNVPCLRILSFFIMKAGSFSSLASHISDFCVIPLGVPYPSSGLLSQSEGTSTLGGSFEIYPSLILSLKSV